MGLELEVSTGAWYVVVTALVGGVVKSSSSIMFILFCVGGGVMFRTMFADDGKNKKEYRVHEADIRLVHDEI